MTLDGSYSVVTARPAVAALEERGIEAEPGLRAAGLSREALVPIENRFPGESVRRLWEAAADAAHDPSFGVHVAEKLPTGAFDVIDYVMSAADNVRSALSWVAQYVRLIQDHANLRLVVEPRHGRIVSHVQVPTPQYEEFSLTLLLVRSRQYSGVHWKPDHMVFQHERRQDDAEVARVFACPISYGASEAEMRFAASILHLPHVRADSRLLSVLTRYADSLLASLPPHGPLLAQVSSTIAHQMVRKLPTLTEIAEAVHMPVRTLQGGWPPRASAIRR